MPGGTERVEQGAPFRLESCNQINLRLLNVALHLPCAAQLPALARTHERRTRKRKQYTRKQRMRQQVAPMVASDTGAGKTREPKAAPPGPL